MQKSRIYSINIHICRDLSNKMTNEKDNKMTNEKGERTKGKGQMGKGKGERQKEKRLPAGMTRAESLYPIVAKIL